MNEPTSPVAEIVTFRLVDGIETEDFLSAARGMTPDLEATGALIRRTLSCDAEGLWTDHLEWRSMAAAEQAARQILALPPAAPFLSAIRPDSVVMRHAPIRHALHPT